MSKPGLKEKAIELRKNGFSYSEILALVPVAKATLSLWFKEVNLSVPQLQRLTQKKLEAALRGAKKVKDQRIALCKGIRRKSLAEVKGLDKNVFWMAGVALYWAEGSKQKEGNISEPVIFSNSDSKMIRFFYKWLIEICKIKSNQIYFEIYTHENCNPELAKLFWSKTIGVGLNNFERVRFKKDKGNSYRKNKGQNYHGLLRIRVRNSTNLNRQIMGWAEGLSNVFSNKVNSGVV
ncbi:MAG: hypothetical protein G01um101413_493 [Parcubacteria group bacterium Gr01-1014_13]|nr:MAG: hypothetical protein G01um101413_493 [Parcubacteria group bacterium Gr01-1014_13]